jgi:hypothetical protein
MPQSILSIDPGPHTGWVEFAISADSAAEIYAHGLVYPSDYSTIATIYRSFLHSAHPPTLVICEKWIDIPYIDHATASEVVQQQIGVIRQLTQDGGVPLVLAPPQARTQITPETLYASGYRMEGRDYDHVRQATRHGLAWLVDHRHRPTIDRLYPRN